MKDLPLELREEVARLVTQGLPCNKIRLDWERLAQDLVAQTVSRADEVDRIIDCLDQSSATFYSRCAYLRAFAFC
jgi:hypothetical protein